MTEDVKSRADVTRGCGPETGTAALAKSLAEAPRVLGNAQPSVAPLSSPALVVSLAKAAEMLDCCKRTIERERDRGELKCLRIGGRWKVRVGELHAYLRRKEMEQGRG